MARYDSAIYGVSTYDSNPVATSLGDVTITATQTSLSTVRVDWRNPTATHISRAIVRSVLGVPPDPVSGQCTTLVLVDATNSTDPNATLTTFTDTVIPGTEAFYAIFVQIVDVDNPNALRWVLGASAYVSMVNDHQTFDRFRSAYPAAFLSQDGVAAGGAVDTSAPLTTVMKTVAGVFDNLLTEAERLESLWDGRHTPSRLLGAVAQSIGMPIEPHLGPRPQRSLVVNSSTISTVKGTPLGVKTLASCLSGRSATLGAGKNLIPTTAASAYEKQTVFSTTLAVAVANGTQTTIQVASIAGWPLRMTTGVTVPPRTMWVTVRSATGTEVMQVSSVQGTVLTVVRGQKGTVAQASHAAASPVTLTWSWNGWDVVPGYDTQVVDATGAGFAMPVATSTSPTQPPLQAHCLKISRVNSTATIVTPTLTFGSKRWVASYSRTGNIGTVTTVHPHNLDVGQRVTAYFGSASITTPTATYSVVAVLDEHVFTVLHTETSGLVNTTMPSSDLVTATPPYIIGHPVASTLVPITAGTTYTYSTQVRAGTTTRGVQPAITWYDSLGNSLSTSTGVSVNSVSGSWATASVSAAAPTGATLAALSLIYDVAGSWATGESHYVTQHQLEAAGSATGYDDGGVVRVGLNASPEIDPYKTIRLRTQALLKSWASDAKTYRVEFMKRLLNLPTGSSYVTITVANQTWQDIDIRIHMIPSSLATTQVIMSANTSGGPPQWEFRLKSTTLELYLNTSTPTTVTSSAHGLSAGTPYWLRVVRSYTTGQVTFYKAVDSEVEPYVWTQISTSANTAGALAAPTLTLTVGSQFTGGLTGSIYYMRLMNGLGEPIDINPWLYDAWRNVIPNGGSIVADWVLSATAPNAVTITTTFP